jgi:hypothetical protein
VQCSHLAMVLKESMKQMRYIDCITSQPKVLTAPCSAGSCTFILTWSSRWSTREWHFRHRPSIPMYCKRSTPSRAGSHLSASWSALQ